MTAPARHRPLSHHIARLGAALAGGALAVGALAACGGSGDPARGETGGGTAGITIVTSTSVWGSVARSVAGDSAGVSWIVGSGAGDPHSFELPPADASRLTGADIVIVNGGGYDSWATNAARSGRGTPIVIDAHASAGTNDGGGHGDHGHHHNVHVFYDIDVVDAVARQLSEKLAERDAAGAAGYRQRYRDFRGSLHTIVDAMAAVKSAHTGTPYLQTEPVGESLLNRGGLTDRTPGTFLEAIHSDQDPSAADIAAMRDALRSGRIRLFVYNPDTAGPSVTQLRDAAREANVSVVELSEALPEGKDYVTWMTENARAIAEALR